MLLWTLSKKSCLGVTFYPVFCLSETCCALICYQGILDSFLNAVITSGLSFLTLLKVTLIGVNSLYIFLKIHISSASRRFDYVSKLSSLHAHTTSHSKRRSCWKLFCFTYQEFRLQLVTFLVAISRMYVNRLLWKKETTYRTILRKRGPDFIETNF